MLRWSLNYAEMVMSNELFLLKNYNFNVLQIP